jgi:hypothetical protein
MNETGMFMQHVEKKFGFNSPVENIDLFGCRGAFL